MIIKTTFCEIWKMVKGVRQKGVTEGVIETFN